MRSQISNTTIIAPSATNSPQAPVRRRRAQSVQAGISRVSEEQRRVSLFESNVSSNISQFDNFFPLPLLDAFIFKNQFNMTHSLKSEESC